MPRSEWYGHRRQRFQHKPHFPKFSLHRRIAFVRYGGACDCGLFGRLQIEARLLSIVSAVVNHFELTPESGEKIETSIEKQTKAIEIPSIPIEALADAIEITM